MNQLILWADHFTKWYSTVAHSNHFVISHYCSIGYLAYSKEKSRIKIYTCFLCRSILLSVFNSPTTKTGCVYLTQHAAIDFMLGKQYYFIGDSVLLRDGLLRNFHLKPSRIAHRTYEQPNINPKENIVWTINNKTIIHINQSYRYDSTAKITADVVIVSNNHKLYLNQLTKTINCKLLVFDGSNPQWKLKYWKNDWRKAEHPLFLHK